jgi:glycosyltransferase involved in cell wall biosynthesis
MVRTAVPRLSVVVPVFNEEGSLQELHRQLGEALAGEAYEIIFVDDGSRDGSWEVLGALCRGDPHVRVLRFGRNLGKAAALAAGFGEAQGEVIITIDADLQDDPAEIPRLLAALEEGYDLVSGWKKERRDPLSKTIPSRVFNWVTSWLTGIPLRDFNSGFKAYRRRLVQNLNVYGEQHRFIPAIAYWKGFRVAEIPVSHRPRLWGKSKYGMGRFLAGFMDLLTVLFLTRFHRRPMHVFGILGLLAFLSGLGISIHLTYIWFQGEPIGTRPLLMLGVLLMVLGVQFFGIGLLAEMIALGSARESAEGPAYQVLEGPSQDDSS